ncbi:MAG: quinone oxidoreductase [Bifidobacteriaceae bacterium]|jgi:NADPH2:quinone reductase|nr:quinone oxidoreductase [Bifidobacteriaceae bacterium]
MRAITIQRPGGASALRLTETDTPEPGPGQALVKVEAAGVNFIDTYRRSGVYRVAFPHVPGTEGAGTVAALGADVTDWAVGDRVAWASSLTGSYAEYALVDAARLIPVPPGLTFDLAAALPLQGMTADYLTRSTYQLGPGDAALIYAAAGGVGQLATQMALAAGAQVIATVGSAGKTETVAGLGVPVGGIVNLAALANLTTELPGRVRDLTDGLGASVAYDGIGRDTFQATLASLRRRGMAVLYGGASGQVPPFDPQELNARGSLYLTRPKLDDYTETPAELRERAARVFDAAADGTLKVSVGHRFPLAEAAAAHEAIESRQSRGKIVLYL